MAAKLRRLRQKRKWRPMRLNRLWLGSSKETVVVAVVEADTALAEAATSANDGDSGNDDGSDKGG